jgi:hypothetical protein
MIEMAVLSPPIKSIAPVGISRNDPATAEVMPAEMRECRGINPSAADDDINMAGPSRHVLVNNFIVGEEGKLAETTM